MSVNLNLTKDKVKFVFHHIEEVGIKFNSPKSVALMVERAEMKNVQKSCIKHIELVIQFYDVISRF